MAKELVISIGWEYFLGILAALIGIAWFAGSRFSALETSIKWLKEALHDLKTVVDNLARPAFGSKSPVNLTDLGIQWLEESGLKNYIDSHKVQLMKVCEEKKDTNPYEIEQHIFKVFDTLDFESGFEDKLKEFAFQKGTTMNIIRRVGAIYFRNICLDEYKMKREDIDRHNPEQEKSQ